MSVGGAGYESGWRGGGLYAAYGANLDPARMRGRCPHSPVHSPGWLRGWRLTFGGEELGWDGALPTIVEAPGSTVFVLLYDVTAEDGATLDAWEGADAELYRRLRLRVDTLDGTVLAWAYVLGAYEGGRPSARCLTELAEAAEAAGAPEDYVAELRSRPVSG